MRTATNRKVWWPPLCGLICIAVMPAIESITSLNKVSPVPLRIHSLIEYCRTGDRNLQIVAGAQQCCRIQLFSMLFQGYLCRINQSLVH